MNDFFKAYSHARAKTRPGARPVDCREITLQATPDILREIASFIQEAARRLETQSAGEEAHLHLRDQWKDWQETYPDIVVFAHQAE